jgi:hypothetical protein
LLRGSKISAAVNCFVNEPIYKRVAEVLAIFHHLGQTKCSFINNRVPVSTSAAPEGIIPVVR